MDKKKILAILIVAIIATGFMIFSTERILVKTVGEDLDLSAHSECSVLVDFYGYFDGERVTVPVVAAPWSIGGQVLDHLGVNVSWVANGQYIDWTSLQVIGSLRIYHLNYAGAQEDITANVGAPLLINRGGVVAKADSAEFVITLDNLLAGVPRTFADEDSQYWDIRVVVTLLGQVTDDYGVSWEDSTGELFANIRIYDAATGFTIDGEIS